MTNKLSIVTWNVNSLRARNDRFFAFLARHSPDVVCLQELKLTEDIFPFDAIKAAGYHAVAYGQKTYNGVAIVSRDEPQDVLRGVGDDDPQARVIAATIRGVRVISAYFPNGSEVASDKYVYKLAWMKKLRAHLDATYKVENKLALCGDYNVAPMDLDIHDPAQWKEGVLANDAVRTALEHVREFGFEDTYRKIHPTERAFSWWDYRDLGFQKNKGLRIDHIYATPSLAATCVDSFIDREERKGKLPSDHAPVFSIFETP